MKTKYALCAMLACIASAVALGQTVSVNYNKSQSFSQYHTYAWASDNANQIQNSILAQQAKSDIDNAMQGKGLQLVQESANPDIILTASGGMKQQTSYQCNGHAWVRRRNGYHHSRAERDRNHDCRPIRREDQVPGMARACSKYAEQQRQQKLADGIEGRREDVQTVACRITAIQAKETQEIL